MKLNSSIVIPTANQRPRKLVRAIHSVLNQEKGNSIDQIEILVSNNSARALNPKMTEVGGQSVLRIVDSSAKPGVSFARNKGVEATQFDIIAFLDDDDWWEKTFLLEMCQALMERNVDLVCCGLWKWKTDFNRSFGSQPDNSMTFQQFFSMKQWVGGSNILIRKDVYIQLGGFDENFPTSNDKDFFIRFLMNNYRYCAVNRRLANIDRTPHIKLSTQSRDKIKGSRLFYNRYAVEMTIETKKEHLFKLLFYEAITNQSYFELIKLLFNYPHKKGKLISSLKTLLRDRQPRFYRVGMWGIGIAKVTGIWKFIGSTLKCLLAIRKYFSLETVRVYIDSLSDTLRRFKFRKSRSDRL